MKREQVLAIRREVRKRGLNFTYVEDEAVDFISCQIEELLTQGHSFEFAFQEAFQQAAEEGMFNLKTKLITPKSIYTMDMLSNYLKVAFRNFSKYKANSAINLLGLVLSLTASIIIGLYLKYEYSFDKEFPELDRLYRVNSISNLSQNTSYLNAVSGMLVPVIDSEIPEVELASDLAIIISNQPLKTNGSVFFDYRLSGVSEDFIEMFNLKEVKGSLKAPFQTLNGIAISESQALKIFGEEDPIGQSFSIEQNQKVYSFLVQAVFQDIPANTHFMDDKWNGFDMLVSMETARSIPSNQPSWTSINSPAYVRLAPGASEETVNAKMNELVVKHHGKEIWYEHYLQPVSDIHLNTREDGISSVGNVQQLKLFGLIGVIILVIACINYVNLTTAQASVRLKEVGVRKVIGARRRQFVMQFLVEAGLMSLMGLIISAVLVSVLIPLLNGNFGLHLSLDLSSDWQNLAGFVGLMLLVSLLCGTYPGWYLSRLRANVLLRSSSSVKSGGGIFRKILVVLQYATSITLIVATLIIGHQMNFLSKKDLGFEKEQVVYLKMGWQAGYKYGELLFNEVSTESGVLAASLTSNTLGDGSLSGNGISVGEAEVEKREMHQVLAVDNGYLAALGLELKEGRWFSEDFASDRKEGFVVNEAFVKHFNLENPIGTKLARNSQNGTIIGVVKDFHFKSMHTAIEPLVMFEDDRDRYWNIALRISPVNMGNTLERLETAWAGVVPDFPFTYQFLDDQIDQYYRSDRDFALVFQVFAGLAIVVSCLGLIGLVAFTTRRRAKEIGVRKVLGASVGTILQLLSLDYVKLILLAAFLAIPVAYYAMSQWLENFEYRVNIHAGVFVLGLLITIVLSWISVSYLSVRAAKSNPVDSLRTE
ncbi:ABC transporter permease [Roseivirga sp. UBA838]|uniref:ABC transporter permease n=1 Tax=Roseivirga sp. UBA838 TaxID=1947393 RepID=UPI00257A0A75|nr:ABC transporter permease [Roseivirga sp. UBA838]|tara:strand:+ start:6412 stop:9042 length:2631 start_codon:yes stop_codon:yes gene_type:complete